MASVNTQGLQAGLDDLVRRHIIQDWQKRPFGMYYIELAFAEDLRSDTKETAMWVMGASHAAEMMSRGLAMDNTWDADEVAMIDGNLDMLKTNKAIQRWTKDADDDYIVQLCNGERIGVRASGMMMWTTGAVLMLLPNSGVTGNSSRT